MDSQVSRRFLGSAGQKHALPQDAMEAALVLSGLRPGPTERRGFALRGIQSAGVISLAFEIIFLVAFNWKYFGVYGRFALVEIPILLAHTFAWIRGLNQLPGRMGWSVIVALLEISSFYYVLEISHLTKSLVMHSLGGILLASARTLQAVWK